MSNLSIAARRRLAAAAKDAPQTKKYRIMDDNHRPDLKGEFGGLPVTVNGTDHSVMMTDAQAKFYLASGAVELFDAEKTEDGQH